MATIVSRETRQAQMLQKAKDLGLIVKQRGPSLFYFTAPNGETVVQYGLWACEIFLQGYSFAPKEMEFNPVSLSWDDSDED